eukprot:NODE_20059_length_162_cov_2.194690_g18289_i0.p5 GENE.NODE_20059_length_162_cov_2.194690_g18289_i0~~NODE_20059_length_162_cov_2.194690_g18289_i0.p5  ORF type:complete len:50 (-),score=24.45 NODE_20059_length_162_cov_2.194690_g18289_i0:12-137(-)
MGVQPGQFTDSEIIVLLGENGTGKVRPPPARTGPDLSLIHL